MYKSIPGFENCVRVVDNKDQTELNDGDVVNIAKTTGSPESDVNIDSCDYHTNYDVSFEPTIVGRSHTTETLMSWFKKTSEFSCMDSFFLNWFFPSCINYS